MLIVMWGNKIGVLGVFNQRGITGLKQAFCFLPEFLFAVKQNKIKNPPGSAQGAELHEYH